VGSFTVLLLGARDARPYDLERRSVEAAGGAMTVIAYEELAERRYAADVVVNAGDWPLDAPRLDNVDGCRAVISYGVGLDWIDVADATARGVLVVHTPLANVEDVAVHTLALLLACSRRLLQYDAHMRSGGFRPAGWPPLHRPAGKRLGLLAFGNIPRRLVPLVRPLGMDVQAWDPHVAPAEMAALGVASGTLDEVISTSDAVSVHVPASPATVGFLDERLLARLKPGTIVLVTSRGRVYDADALADALHRGQVGAAGLDVFPDEPLPPDSPLLGCPNTILTPHVAGFSAESDLEARSTVATALAVLARGAVPPGAVNAAAIGPGRLTTPDEDVTHSSSYVL
jgi:D-3-phosphoglycerate dehydrogenase